MKKRDFLKTSAILSFGAMINPLMSCENNANSEKKDQPKTSEDIVFELPELEYELDALEPHIDARTMEIHHGKTLKTSAKSLP